MSSSRRIELAGLASVLACALGACEPKLVVGKMNETNDGAPSTCVPAGDGSAGASSAEKLVEIGWSTGFEDGFCGYQPPLGFCYGDPGATREIVDAPVRSGSSAAAFTVTSDPALDGRQTRCFLEGTLPADAVYGAWFYVPALVESALNWNLIHFQGGAAPPIFHNLWDVSLARADDGSLTLYVRDFMNGNPNGGDARFPEMQRPIPIGDWFHVEFRLRRAADATGLVALYQDESPLLEVPDIVTDDSEIGQFYVGNLVGAITPPESTVYVDDVTVRAEP